MYYICMLAIAGQKAGPIGLIFLGETHGYLVGNMAIKKLKNLFS